MYSRANQCFATLLQLYLRHIAIFLFAEVPRKDGYLFITKGYQHIAISSADTFPVFPQHRGTVLIPEPPIRKAVTFINITTNHSITIRNSTYK